MAPGGFETGTPHVYVVPTGTMFPPPSVGVSENDDPLQIVAVKIPGIDAFGLIVMVYVDSAPEHIATPLKVADAL